MISRKHLRQLIEQKLKDAEILFANSRYNSAIYLAGYALELCLKMKICKIFKFSKGFPENKAEFSVYLKNAKSHHRLAGATTQIKDIKTHDLDRLLYYSGVEYHVKLHFLQEWNLVVTWNPEIRYKIQRIRKKEAVERLAAINTIVYNIL